MRGAKKAGAWAAAAGCVVLAGGCASTGGTRGLWADQSSANAGGGMPALIQAARAEGRLNVIRLRHDWANYGAIISAFSANR